MQLEEFLKSLNLEIERFLPFEELEDPIMRNLLSKYSVGLDNDADFKCANRVFLSKFEGYGIAPETTLYPQLIDPVRRCYIITKGILKGDAKKIYV